MDTNKPKKISLLWFVLTDPRYNLIDRAEYVLFLVIALTSIVWLLTDIIRSLYINPYGLATVAAIVMWMVRINIKYITPYLKILGVDSATIEQQQQGIESLAAAATRPNGAGGPNKPSILPYLAVILIVVVVCAAVLTFHLPVLILDWTIMAGLIAMALLTIKGIWGVIRAARADYLGAARMPYGKYRLAGAVFFWVLLLGSLVFVYWRYNALTGHSPVDFMVDTTKNVEPIADGQYVLLQFTGDADDLADDITYDSDLFSYDRSRGELNLYNFDSVKKYYTDPQIMVLSIEDDETSRKFDPDDLYMISPGKLPFFLPFETYEYDRPQLLQIGADGTLYIKQKRYDARTAEVDRNLMVNRNQRGVVYETVKVAPGQTYEFSNEMGKKMKLIHLGVFPISKIAFLTKETGCNKCPDKTECGGLNSGNQGCVCVNNKSDTETKTYEVCALATCVDNEGEFFYGEFDRVCCPGFRQTIVQNPDGMPDITWKCLKQ